MKVTSLYVFVVKNRYVGFFSILRTVMVDTLLYSKMVRKVKLSYLDLLLYRLENCSREKTFSLIRKSE